MKVKSWIGGIAISCAMALGAHASTGDHSNDPIVVAAVSPAELQRATHDATRQVQGKSRIWCVPFARLVSGVEIRGNANTWWNQAGNEYPRGHTPITGAVLNFRSSKAMPMGHVAVVAEVVDSRTIKVVQANWTRNRITVDAVIDVSPRNDWSQVRVDNGGSFGRVNPAYGFIYRPAETLASN
ncbi:CHAP domain-containing protein [Falsirhodobacter xinxiangensis]|uniref:CHAP domain-containing protein n=1 Tax=Falsirhodobacter xinxiangensis TaxID=2530049 RepID=UPI0010AB4E75|nr:CHAP domain-containing protein [Rhodobacter xinxiangensis]